jgi:O-antigen ligase
MTGSRNGLIQIVLLGALILREQWQRSHAQRANVLVLMLAVALLALTVAPSAMLQRASSFDVEGGPTTIDRLLTLRAGAAMMAESPLLGIGPGNFHWRNESLTGRAMSSHNSYLWALTAGGPLLLLLYLILFRQTHRMLRLVEQWGSSAFVWLATAFRFNLIILLTFSFFADMWLTSIVAFLVAFTIVLLRVGVTNAEAGAQLRSPHFV